MVDTLEPLKQTLDVLAASLTSQLSELQLTKHLESQTPQSFVDLSKSFANIQARLNTINIVSSLRELSRAAYTASMDIEKSLNKVQNSVHLGLQESQSLSQESSYDSSSLALSLQEKLDNIKDLKRMSSISQTLNQEQRKTLVSKILNTIESVNSESNIDLQSNSAQKTHDYSALVKTLNSTNMITEKLEYFNQNLVKLCSNLRPGFSEFESIIDNINNLLFTVSTLKNTNVLDSRLIQCIDTCHEVSNTCKFKDRAEVLEQLITSYRIKQLQTCPECRVLSKKMAELRLKSTATSTPTRKGGISRPPTPSMSTRIGLTPDSLRLSTPASQKRPQSRSKHYDTILSELELLSTDHDSAPIISSNHEQSTTSSDQKKINNFNIIQSLKAHTSLVRHAVILTEPWTSDIFMITVDVTGSARIWHQILDQNFEFYTEITELGDVTAMTGLMLEQSILIAIVVDSKTVKLYSVGTTSDRRIKLLATLVVDDSPVLSLTFEDCIDDFPRLLIGLYQKIHLLRTDPTSNSDILTVSRALTDHSAMSFYKVYSVAKLVVGISTGVASVFDLRDTKTFPLHRINFLGISSPLVALNSPKTFYLRSQSESQVISDSFAPGAALSVVIPPTRATNFRALEVSFELNSGKELYRKSLPFRHYPKLFSRTSLSEFGFDSAVLATSHDGSTVYCCVQEKLEEKFAVIAKHYSPSNSVQDVICCRELSIVVVLMYDGTVTIMKL
ncbi:hypothetical protein RCL1_005618 [Eukaryota sp. TZLM3-RCL]